MMCDSEVYYDLLFQRFSFQIFETRSDSVVFVCFFIMLCKNDLLVNLRLILLYASVYNSVRQSSPESIYDKWTIICY